MTGTSPQPVSGPAWASARRRRADVGHETRTALLDAAARVFAQLGYAATTVAAITDEAAVSRPTFYVYFESKRDVFREVAVAVRDEFLAAHEIPGVDEDDPRTLGRASTAAHLAAWAANVELITVIRHQAIDDDDVATVWNEMNERPRARVRRYIARLVEAGVARPPADPELMASIIVAMFAGVAAQVPSDEAGFTRMVDQMTEVYIRLLGV